MSSTNRIALTPVAAIIAGILLAACAPAASDTSPATAATPFASPAVAPSLAASAPASAEASPSAEPGTASPAATPGPAGLAPDTIGRVLVTELVVRSAPGVGADSTILDGQLTLEDPVYVIDGPVAADGYQWILASRALADPGSPPIAGWVAIASREGEAWVESIEPPCPSSVDVVALSGMSGEQALYCFGGDELTLGGALGFCGHADPVIQEPGWLANESCAFEAPDRPGVSSWPTISVHFEPAVRTPPYTGGTTPARLIGRYDHSAAASCRYIEGAADPPPTELDAMLLAFRCRMAFVVEEVELLAP